MSFNGSELIEKKNVLNELRNNNMTLQELRFFSIYLSKINARDITTRAVRFPLSDFQRIMDIGADMNITHFKLTVRRILQQIVEVPNENDNGYTAFQLFKEFQLAQDDNGEWYVEIDAHDKALPLMFDFKSRYFSYELWNALRLHSPNQIRMYEILKQYEKVGKRELKVSELRELLGIAPTEYPRWDNFRARILDGCQQALKENTDICYTYERGKAGRGGKWLTIVFTIEKNADYVDQLTLSEFINLQSEEEINVGFEPDESLTGESFEVVTEYDEEQDEDLLSEACHNEFNYEEMERIKAVIRTVPVQKLPKVNFGDVDVQRYHYLEQQYKAMLFYDKRNKIKNRLSYLLKIIENDAKC